MAERTIIDIGRYLQKRGLDVGEHPAFGGVGKGHSPTGYHPIGAAIDVRDWRPDMAPAYEGGKSLPWKQRTGELSWRAKQLGLFNEALGPGDKGHDTHVHLALEGKKYITDPQLEWLATGRYRTPEGTLTDVMPTSVQQGGQTTTIKTETSGDAFDDLLNSYIEDQLVSQMTQQVLQPKSSRLSQFAQLMNMFPTGAMYNPLIDAPRQQQQG
jgi:hypothetical protein